MARRWWTRGELDRGRELRARGLTLRQVAAELGRSYYSCRNALGYRWKAERRRLPREETAAAALDALAVLGRANSARVAEALGCSASVAQKALRLLRRRGLVELGPERGLAWNKRGYTLREAAA